MSQVEETQIMLQTRYRVKRLMEKVLTWFDENKASMRRWKDLENLCSLLIEVQSYTGDCARQNQMKLMEEIEAKVHLTADFLDEVVFRAGKGPQGKDMDALTSDGSRKDSKALTSSSQTAKTRSLNEKLEEVRVSLQSLIKACKAYNLQTGVIPGSDLDTSSKLELHKKKPRFSALGEVAMIGRSTELNNLIKKLLMPGKDEESSLQIIPIVGEEGIGKTTLARAAFDDEQIKNYFDHRIWVCASASNEAKGILECILEALAPNRRVELESVDEIIEVLLEELEGKSFFLVLDDVSATIKVAGVSDETDLPRIKLLKDCLLKLNTTRRNKIVITTSSDDIVKETNMHDKLSLKKLSGDDCEAIWEKMSRGYQKKDKQQSIKSEGIPLAVKVLHQFPNSVADVSTSEALNLSYDNLPPDAQKCFIYMSIFPPSTPIEVDNLIQLWVAQGYFEHQETTEMDEWGFECLNDLLNKYLIEPAEMDSYGYKSVKLVRIAWELASSMLRSTEKHVSIHAGQKLVQPPENAELHTFFSVGSDVHYGKYDFKSLRVLNLSKSEFKKWPMALEDMGNLRYIDVSGTKVAELPESITQLTHLQTIRAVNCPYLKRLPKDLSKLQELRHFCLDADNEAIRGHMSSGLSIPTCLQTLPLVVITKTPQQSVEELGPLKKLRGKLTICNLEHLTQKEAKELNLMKKKGIVNLVYEWTTVQSPTDIQNEVLENLQPNEMLKELTLQNFAGNEITMWNKTKSQADNDSAFLKHLVKLKLSNCNNCQKLPTLGILPCLAELHLEGMENLKSIGSEFYTDEHTGTTVSQELFPKLRKFTMMYLAKLESWLEAQGTYIKVFPLLEELRVEGCDELDSAPSNFPALERLHVESVHSGEPLADICRNLTTLTSVFISSVPNLLSLPEGILRDNPKLSSLRICNCLDLTTIPNPKNWGCSNSLRSLSISECDKLEDLPETLHDAYSLIELIISQCKILKKIPSIPRKDDVSSLRRLKIEWCECLESLPNRLDSCTFLEHLTIKGCPRLTSVQDEGLSKTTSLCSVNIQGCKELTALPLRELGHYLSKLKRLEIEGFTEDLIGLTIEYPGLKGWIRFKALPKPLQTQQIKGAWTIDPKLLDTFATKAVGFLEAMQLFEKGVKTIS